MKKHRFVVYEYNKNAPEYEGCRFMTLWRGPIENHNSTLDIVAENVSEEDAKTLLANEKKSSLDIFIKSLPSYIVDPEIEKYIREICSR